MLDEKEYLVKKIEELKVWKEENKQYSYGNWINNYSNL